MYSFGPRSLTPRDGLDWMIAAWRLMLRYPGLFIAVALFAPTGSAVLLALPVWEWLSLPTGSWLALLATIICYGLPLSLTVTLACSVARAANRRQTPPVKQLVNWTALRVVTRTCLLLFLLVLQGYLLVYWVWDQMLSIDFVIMGDDTPPSLPSAFGVASTLLGTQLSVLGATVLVLQVLLAGFIAPLQLFQELPLPVCWQRSALAMQLNSWLVPVLGLVGLALLVLPFFDWLGIPAQVLALPLPVYFGTLLYVAWNDVFQGGTEEEEYEELQDLWRAEVSGRSVSRQSYVALGVNCHLVESRRQ
ncbi:MAG: hypothetical protein CSA09_00165 [Candidatus Contendobacter odensis]|uniref:Uncharacterized protein n=1 Tax=Candidatus Contendibacter odensensis TaxID=1400860 RepID=A0A2G6PGM9_9GAMM|nr:MAG: hypothetical protein CSA09_00165 [Candidatus Contendobacter odensis]